MLASMSARADGPPPRWLVTRAFDLTWFFGGAALSLIVLGLYFVAGAPIVALWWIWLLAFDGPHIGAAFTRTYFDRDEWRRRPGLLLTSLLTFALGPLFLAATLITGSPDPFLLFLAFATFYGYYHVVRQPYGFVALYNTVNHDWNPRSVGVPIRTATPSTLDLFQAIGNAIGVLNSTPKSYALLVYFQK